MPVFHKYSESYHKSGYYVKVNWSAPHPYPLQTPGITEQIYLELGLNPGDQVPNELTSRLYNAGLHWTEGNGTGDPQKQTDLNSIAETKLPSLSPEQIQRIHDILDRVEGSSSVTDADQESLQELRSELSKLNQEGKNQTKKAIPGKMPSKTISSVQDLSPAKLTDDQISEMRENSDFPGAFDHSVYQFSRKHPITPTDFEVNKHGSPTYTFQSGPIEWTLSDCRPDSLYFDWAIEVESGEQGCFNLRVSRQKLENIVFEGSTLSDQQAANLVTIIPCLIWAVDLINDYQLSQGWMVQGVKSNVEKEWYTLLRKEVKWALRAISKGPNTDDGVIIDLPDHQFARIRTTDRAILFTPVERLPNSVERGDEVSFEVDEKNGAYYATNIQKESDGFDKKRIPVTINGGSTSHTFYLHKPTAENWTESVQVVDDLFREVGPSTALGNEKIRKFILELESENTESRQR